MNFSLLFSVSLAYYHSSRVWSTRPNAYAEQVEHKLVHRRIVSSRDAMATGVWRTMATEAAAVASKNCSDDVGANDNGISMIRRRDELHKKLETLHERHSLRSGHLIERLRQDASLPTLPTNLDEADE